MRAGAIGISATSRCADADEETVAAWPMPSPDDFDYSGSREACAAQREYAVHCGGAGLACIMNTAGFLRGMEQAFVDLALDEPAGLLLIDRMLAIQLEITRRELEAAHGGIDFMWIGEDLGTQRGPLISMDDFPAPHQAAPPAVLRPGQSLRPAGDDPHLRLEQLGL